MNHSLNLDSILIEHMDMEEYTVALAVNLSQLLDLALHNLDARLTASDWAFLVTHQVRATGL